MNNNGHCQNKSPCKYYHPSSVCKFWKAGNCSKDSACTWPHFNLPKSQANMMLNQAEPNQPKPKAKGKAKPKAKRRSKDSQPSTGNASQPKGKAKAKAKSKPTSGAATPQRHDLVNTLNQTSNNLKEAEKKLRRLKQKKKATQQALNQGSHRIAIGVPDNAPEAGNPFGAGSIIAAPVHSSPLNP